MTTALLIDVRGLSCPQPVMQAREALKTGHYPVHVLVDTVTSRENVRRMAEFLGCLVRIEKVDDGFKLIITQR
jgi:tRNA 2-thiouridine synthesizing protein A